MAKISWLSDSRQQVERMLVIMWKKRSKAVMHWQALDLKLPQEHCTGNPALWPPWAIAYATEIVSMCVDLTVYWSYKVLFLMGVNFRCFVKKKCPLASQSDGPLAPKHLQPLIQIESLLAKTQDSDSLNAELEASEREITNQWVTSR